MSFYGLTSNSALSSRSCNGDVHEPSSDDEMFVNSRLGLEGYDRPQSLFLELEEAKYCEKLKYTMSPLFSPLTPQNEQDAIIFSINLFGKNFGELGLFEPDISILDWEGFKSYLCSSLNLENSDSFIISYDDDEGDKIPIQSEIEYNEALRLAKDRSRNHEKFHLNITRMSSGFPRTLRSLMSSSLRRVNSVGGNRQAPPPPQRRSITTSTSFIDLRNRNFEMVDVKSDNYSPDFPDSLTSWGGKTVLPIRLVLDFDTEENTVTRLYNCVNDSFAVMNYTVKPFDKLNYNKTCFSNPFPVAEAIDDQNLVSYQVDLTCLLSRDENKEAPSWFQDSMQKMKGNMMNDISSILSDNFQDFVGNLHDFDVEEKLRRMVNYDQCKGHACSRQASIEAKREEDASLVKECQERHLKEIQSLQGLKAKIEDNQLQLFTFIQNSNEELKRKLSTRDLPLHKYSPNQEQLLYIEERERVLARIQGCSQRQSLGAAISAADNVQKMLNSSLTAPVSMNAKFCEDVTYPDGALVQCGQKCTKTWKIINTGSRPWTSEVLLVSLHNPEMSRGLIPSRFETMCPPLAPEEQGFVSVDFVTPNTPGMCMNKWCFKMNGCEFGDILWCSVKAFEPDVIDPKIKIGPAGVLKSILNLLAQQKPNFDDAPECQQELDLVVNYLQKSNFNSYLAIKSFLKTNSSNVNNFPENQGVPIANNAEEYVYGEQDYAECSEPSIDNRFNLSEDECGNKEDRGTPETEEADSHHFRSQRVITQSSTSDRLSSSQNLTVIPVEEYEDHEVSEYCDSRSEMNNSEEEEDYPSDALEYEEAHVIPTTAVVQDFHANDPKGDEVYQESETENDYEETDHDDEDEGTEFDDERAEEEDDLVTESESEMIEEEEARKLESTSRSCTDKKFTLSEDNFKQNVQVQLDFEILSRPPVLQTSASTSAVRTLTQTQPGPLTFREQHFTTSGFSLPPPPIPVQVPESDDDFDGVFIPEDGLPLNLPPQKADDVSSKDDDSSSSSSTSSFSECDDDDLPLAPQENSPSIPVHEIITDEASGDANPDGFTNGENISNCDSDATTEPDVNICSNNPDPIETTSITEDESENIQDTAEVGESSNLVGESSNLVGESSNLVGESSNLVGESSNLVDESSNLVDEYNENDKLSLDPEETHDSVVEVDVTCNSVTEQDEASRLASSNSGTTSTSPTILDAIPSSSDSNDPLVSGQSEEDSVDVISK